MKTISSDDGDVAQAVMELLKQYACPASFAVARSRFMGAIASPMLGISPIRVITTLWNGRLPEFASDRELERFTKVLLMGWWNRLARHQDYRAPFALTRVPISATLPDLRTLAQMRRREIEAFLDGYFDDADQLRLPTKADQAFGQLATLSGLFQAAGERLATTSVTEPSKNLEEIAHELQAMGRIANDRINEVVQATRRARVRSGVAMAPSPTPRHRAAARVHPAQS